MSNKFFKKIRKEARKQVNQKYGEGIDVLRKLVRPRPKYCPKFIWIIFYLPLFKRITWRYLYKNI